MHLSNLSKAFQKTPARLKDASLEGMPLHQKQRELKTNVEIAKAEMTRTAPEGIRANNKGDIRIKNNLGPDQIGDRSAYNGACIKYEKANHELNMFNKTNAKGLKDEAKADTKLRKQDGTGALPSPRSASIADAAGSRSMAPASDASSSRRASWEAGDDAAAMGLAPKTPTLNAAGSGSMATDARAAAGTESPVDRFGMPTHYTTQSGQQIPGYLFPGHEQPGSGRAMDPSLTFSNHGQAQELDKYGMPKHYTTESGQKIPGYVFPGHEAPEHNRPLSPSLTFEQPQAAASHSSMAPVTPQSNPQAYLDKARNDLLGGAGN